jgi:hypothetical protein
MRFCHVSAANKEISDEHEDEQHRGHLPVITNPAGHSVSYAGIAGLGCLRHAIWLHSLQRAEYRGASGSVAASDCQAPDPENGLRLGATKGAATDCSEGYNFVVV